MRLPVSVLASALALVLLAVPAAGARDAARAQLPVPAHGVIGVEDAHFSPAFWVSRLKQPDQVLMDRAAIAAQNAELVRVDKSMHDLRALPATLDGATVRGWIEDLSVRPERPRHDLDGRLVDAATLGALVANLALDAVPASQPT